jgi:hypothetical protein
MSTAVVGLLGVVAGAIVTGGVQLTIARFDRRRASRTAARLLYMQLWWAHNAMDRILENDAWDPRVEWGRFIDAWIEYRADLAQKLTTKHFLIVSAALTGIEQIGLCRADDLAQPTPDGTPSFSAAVPDLVRIYNPYVQRAKVVLNRASFGWWEWRIRRSDAHASQGEAESHPRRTAMHDASNIEGA